MIISLLDDIQHQTIIKRTEVIVVDNASTDQTYDKLLKSKYITKLVKLDINVGCAGRNEGMRIATSQYIVTIDDDVFFNKTVELENIVEFFNENDEVHALNFKILFPDTKEIIPFNWYHPRDYCKSSSSTFATDYISEGAVAFRKKCFEKTGYYPSEFFLSHEGLDLAYRFINNGYNVFYSGDIEVLHMCSNIQRTSWRNTYYDTRNYFWLIVRNYPINKIFVNCIIRLITSLLIAISRGQIIWYIRAVRDAITGIPLQIKNRNVLSKVSMNKIKKIRKYQPNILNMSYSFVIKIIAVNKLSTVTIDKNIHSR